jgi:hypothetical protein
MTQLLKLRSIEQVSQIVSYRKKVREFFDALVNSDAPIAEYIPRVYLRRKRGKVARAKRGSGKPRKLSVHDVFRMRSLVESGSMTRSEIGRRFSVSGTTVTRVMCRD